MSRLLCSSIKLKAVISCLYHICLQPEIYPFPDLMEEKQHCVWKESEVISLRAVHFSFYWNQRTKSRHKKSWTSSIGGQHGSKQSDILSRWAYNLATEISICLAFHRRQKYRQYSNHPQSQREPQYRGFEISTTVCLSDWENIHW